MTTEEREKELQELDRKLRQQVQILLESKEGRDLWAGEIQFQSIQMNNSSVSISYVDADGAKTFTCEEQPREEFRTAMAAMSFYYTDMAGDYGLGKPAQAIFAVDKVVPKRDKKSGALKGVRLSGRFHIKDSAATQRFSTIEDITPTDNVLRIMMKRRFTSAASGENKTFLKRAGMVSRSQAMSGQMKSDRFFRFLHKTIIELRKSRK